MVEDVAAFGFRVRGPSRRLVIELWGELDIFAAQQLSARLTSLIGEETGDVILDLSGVSFIDCSGLSLLCTVRDRVLQRQRRLALVSDDPFFLRVLRLTGLADTFTVIGCREAATDAVAERYHRICVPVRVASRPSGTPASDPPESAGGEEPFDLSCGTADLS
ncbi:STAS domain-containing protein [Streptomyces sp. NBC_00626]